MSIYLLENRSLLNGGRADLLTIHDSHVFPANFVKECRNCWGCTCHAPDVLMAPCQYTVEVEAYSVGTVEAIQRQAYRYGEQIRLLEDYNTWESDMADVPAAPIRRAWVLFREQLKGTSLLHTARASYYEAYERKQ